MSLRKSPTPTPASLAANRANAKKSTGPRTADGKTRAALNAFRHGLYAPKFLSALVKSPQALKEFRALYLALEAALLPERTDKSAMDLLERTAVRVWAMRQDAIRWAASRAQRDAWFAKTGGVLPAPDHFLMKRPGWRVLVSVWVRRGRRRGHCRLLEQSAGWKEGRASLHVGVTVTASMRHPELGYSSLADVPEGLAPRVVFKTKPECTIKSKSYRNMITIKDLPALLAVRFRSRGPDERPCPSPRRVQTFAELLDLAPGHDPAHGSAGTATNDLISWLSPKNGAFRGTPLSESDDFETWVEGILTKLKKQYGSLPKKEVLPHEVG
jgi:hypothetical protein